MRHLSDISRQLLFESTTDTTDFRSDVNIPLFINLCRMRQLQLKQYMSDFLTQYSYRCISNGHDTPSYIYAKGDIPVCLVAHLDTVFGDMQDKEIIVNGDVITSPQGLGADDRAGVFAITEIIKRGLRPDVLLVTDEEYGQQGTKAFVKSPYFADFAKRTNYIIGLDLDGTDRIKFYNEGNKDFVQRLKNLTRYETVGDNGNMSDVVVLRDGFVSDLNHRFNGCDLCVVNIGMGWKHEHSLTEEINIVDLCSIIRKVTGIIESVPMITYRHEKSTTPNLYSTIRDTIKEEFGKLSPYRKAHLAIRSDVAGLGLNVKDILREYAEKRAFRVIDELYDNKYYGWVFNTCVLEGYDSEVDERKIRMRKFLENETGVYRQFLCYSAFLEIIGYFFRTGHAYLLESRFDKIEELIQRCKIMPQMLINDKHNYAENIATKYYNTLFFVYNIGRHSVSGCDLNIPNTKLLTDEFFADAAKKLLNATKKDTNTTNLYGMTHFVIAGSDFYTHETLPQCNIFKNFLKSVDYKKYKLDLQMELALVLSMLGEKSANIVQNVEKSFDGKLLSEERGLSFDKKEHTNVLYLIYRHKYSN